MRNLSLIATEYDSFDYANAHLTATAFDLDENVLYATSERKNLDGEVEVELWKVMQRKGLNRDVQVHRFYYITH
jgi:elongator complex protein 1